MQIKQFETLIYSNFQFAGFTGDLVLTKYISNGANALVIKSETDGPIATCTLNIVGLKADELAIKDYSENAGMLDALIDQGAVLTPHRLIDTGFVHLPVVRLASSITP